MRTLLIALVLLSGCTNHHRLVLVYEAGDAAVHGDSEVLLNTKGKKDE